MNSTVIVGTFFAASIVVAGFIFVGSDSEPETSSKEAIVARANKISVLKEKSEPAQPKQVGETEGWHQEDNPIESLVDDFTAETSVTDQGDAVTKTDSVQPVQDRQTEFVETQSVEVVETEITLPPVQTPLADSVTVADVTSEESFGGIDELLENKPAKQPHSQVSAPRVTTEVEPVQLVEVTNPEVTGLPVTMLFNGQQQTLQPGQSIDASTGDSIEVIFSRGGDFGYEKLKLAAGKYSFAVSREEGWKLDR